MRGYKTEKNSGELAKQTKGRAKWIIRLPTHTHAVRHLYIARNVQALTDRALLIDRLANDIDDAAQGCAAHGNLQIGMQTLIRYSIISKESA